MHGVFNLDKPIGLSSQQAVTRVKKLLGVRKAGHAGTLDPMATGVLLVCLGEGTKISSLLMDMPKTYEAELHLGVSTDTLDAEGSVIERRPVAEFPMQEIEAALGEFSGEISQVPPMYSAIKKDGRPLYELARQGKSVERKERRVTIYSIEAMGYVHPRLSIRVSCSKGTYIRTLAEDIAGRLGTLAHLSALRRTRVGGFAVQDARTLQDLEGISPSEAASAVTGIDQAISGLREVVLKGVDFAAMSHGGFARAADYGLDGHGGILRLKGPEGGLFALGSASKGRIKVERILHLMGQT